MIVKPQDFQKQAGRFLTTSLVCKLDDFLHKGILTYLMWPGYGADTYCTNETSLKSPHAMVLTRKLDWKITAQLSRNFILHSSIL